MKITTIQSCITILRWNPCFMMPKKTRHVLFLVDIYEAKVIIAVLLDIFLFLAYSYISLLMRLIEIIKTLILLFILLHLYGLAITRLAEGCTQLLGP